MRPRCISHCICFLNVFYKKGKDLGTRKTFTHSSLTHHTMPVSTPEVVPGPSLLAAIAETSESDTPREKSPKMASIARGLILHP